MNLLIRIIAIIIFHFCQTVKAQNVGDYILSNGVVLSDEAIGNKNLIDNLLGYKYYFFGELHTAENVAEKEMILSEFLIKEKKIKLIFTEMSVLSRKNYEELLNTLPQDTSGYLFRKTALYNPLEVRTLRQIYSINQNILEEEEKVKYIPIDEVEYPDINVKQLIAFFSKNGQQNKTIRSNVDILKKIRRRIFNRKRNEKDYYHFCINYNRDSLIYKKYLDIKTYSYMNKIVDGMLVYFDMKAHNEHFNNIGSERRDSFMCRNIMEETLNGKIEFISINGQFHTPLNIQEEWFGLKCWKSLAYQFNQRYGKVCSICFINRNNDYLSDSYFPKEKQMILENTKPGETYLIRLDGENTPFKALSEKFQYIVVW